MQGMHVSTQGEDELFIPHTKLYWGYPGYANARTVCRGSRVIHTHVQICIGGMRGMRGMHVSRRGEDELFLPLGT